MINKRLQKKLKVGDTVKIISKKYVESLPLKGEELHFSFIRPMKKYCGKIARIETIEEGSVPCYKLNIDDGYYSWSSGMFETAAGTYVLRNE